MNIPPILLLFFWAQMDGVRSSLLILMCSLSVYYLKSNGNNLSTYLVNLFGSYSFFWIVAHFAKLFGLTLLQNLLRKRNYKMFYWPHQSL